MTETRFEVSLTARDLFVLAYNLGYHHGEQEITLDPKELFDTLYNSAPTSI